MAFVAAQLGLMARALGLGAGLLWLAAPYGQAHADKVHLQGGSVLEGKVAREGDKVLVRLESGSIRLEAASVLRIEVGETALERITKRRAALAEAAVAERMELANVCRTAELGRCERELLEEVIAREPNHAEARARLGYVRGESGWLTREEQTARAAAIERVAQRQQESAAAQAALLRAAATLALQKDELSAERERAVLERERLERERALSAPRNYVTYWLPYGLTSKLPSASQPASPYMINGVRSPHEAGFNLPGVRSPASYFR